MPTVALEIGFHNNRTLGAKTISAGPIQNWMAKAAGCSERTITHIRKTYGCLAVLVRLQSVLSRPRSITPPMLDALCDHLTEKPGLYVDEMVVFLQDEFDILTSTASVKRALCCAGWTKMKAQQRAKKSRTRSLVPDYLHRLSEFSSYHLVYVDESGIKQICFDAGVKLLYLQLYSPDLSPAEEFFAELKAYIRKNRSLYDEDPRQGFGVFLQQCVDVVGARIESAEGHFRSAGVSIETCCFE
ncbi:conserved hypothetical protein [Histoplasma capsulatum G186AR]|uniref:Tc1-like transposase DDE domain-containing protein n=1 Tax=Ajellomyces capsulatus (strain G186AR / H82 / ATCC MYA-2454 / RMSCC 2432) TaxID=447093 RepID=C0NLQ8_AJECG|nr:uncharacterized protein HCBG_04438 [Histoplasma capsulatum G186AR]EEH07559.1 conserved hypothetical protein [Histoplasma capsulatum G186AR]